MNRYKKQLHKALIGMCLLKMSFSPVLLFRVVPSPSWRPARGPLTSLEWLWLPRWSRWTQSRPRRSRCHSLSPLLFSLALCFPSQLNQNVQLRCQLTPESGVLLHTALNPVMLTPFIFKNQVPLELRCLLRNHRSRHDFHGQPLTNWCQNLIISLF